MECNHSFNLVDEEKKEEKTRYIFQCRKCHRLIKVDKYDYGEIEVNTYKD